MAHANTLVPMRGASKPPAQQAAAPVHDRLITDKEVAHLLGASRSWPWKLARAGRFPQPIKLSARCTRWRLSDVQAWMDDPQGWQPVGG